MRYLLLFLITTSNFPAAQADTGAEFYAEALTAEAPTKRVKLLDKALAENSALPDAYFLRGKAYLQLDDCARALPDFSKTIELAPDTLSARYYRASCYIELGRTADAMKDYDALAERFPASADVYFNRALAQAETGKALADINKTLELNPAYLQAYPVRARLEFRNGQFAKAEADYTRAITGGMENELRLERANIYYLLGNFEAAAGDYITYLSSSPQNYAAAAGLAQTYITQRKAKEAVDAAIKAVQLRPQSAETLCLLGQSYELLGDTTAAVSAYSGAIEKSSTNYLARANRAKLYLEAKELGKAVTDADAAISANEYMPYAYTIRGQAYFEMKNYAAAEKDFLKVAAITPHDAKIRLPLARIYFGSDTSAAITQLESAMESDYAKTSPLLLEWAQSADSGTACSANTALGLHEAAQKQTEKAIKYFKKSEACPRARFELALLYKQERKFALALPEFNKALEYDPKNPAFYFERGKFYYDMRQTDRAYKDFTQAAALNPRDPDIYNYMGRMFLRVKMYEKAEAEFSKAIALSSGAWDAYSNRALARMRQDNIAGAKEDLEDALKSGPK
ncbi:MAG: tetratricopeptide repeat protein, partial [Elusimicrobiaceae bacterium]